MSTVPVNAQTTPVLVGAASRKAHGAAGTFDLALSLDSSTPTSEPRQGPLQTIVFTFDKPVTSGLAGVTEGTATLGVVTFNGSAMVVQLTGVANLQYVTVAVTNVAAADGGTGGSGAVRVGYLAGDVNGNRVVTLSDLGQVNAQVAQPVTAANFLKDVNASGTLSLADKGITNAHVTKALGAVPPAANAPPHINAGANQTLTLGTGANLTANASDDGLPGPLTLAWSKVSGPGTVAFANPSAATTSVTFSAAGTYVLRLSGSDGMLGNFDDVAITVEAGEPVVPPDPGTVAPPLDRSVATDVRTSTAFLYTGANPIQTGVAPGTIDVKRAAVLRGRVLDRSDAALPGVTIAILDHPEFGQTLTRADGRFDLAVNGGGALTITYTKSGFLPMQRRASATWQDYAVIEDVVMIPLDAQVTPIDLAASTPIQVAQGSSVTDSDGTRRATLLFSQGTTGTVGGTPITSLHIRATEYTVGPNGPKAMPARLPPSSAYTYAVELSADEAPGQDILFSKPVVMYVENFLGFPVGGIVPVGYYDRTKSAWLASNNGRVIRILGATAGLADLDVTGDGIADTGNALSTLGITDAERQTLATLYAPGQSLWRVPITHFSPWDCNWPGAPPPDAKPPGGGAPLPKPSKPGTPTDDDCIRGGSIIYCQGQSLGEALNIAGAPFALHYNSERVPGRKAAYVLNIPLSGAALPTSLRRIELQIEVAGRKLTQSFGTAPNQNYEFTWDGRDAYGRLVQGAAAATVRVGYVYGAIYLQPAEFDQSFAAFSGIPITGSRAREEVTLWRITRSLLGSFGALPGGWNVSPHHAFDPVGRVLHKGDGTRRDIDGPSASVIATVAGNGTTGFGGDGGPAIQAALYGPSGLAVAPDGGLYVADNGNRAIRHVGPDGIVTTVAGNGSSGFSGDGGPAAQATLVNPFAVALAPDGSLYIADFSDARIRRIGPNGIIATVVGTGVAGFSGDGGPATQAQISAARGVAVSPDGSLYIADTGNHRIRRVGPEGIITTMAGTGTPFYSGDGGPAILAALSAPAAVAVGPDGSLYIADSNSGRVRRVGTDGIISTVAGKGGRGYTGDGGPATQAMLGSAPGIAVSDEGDLYIVDGDNYRVRRVGTDGIINAVAGSGTPGFGGDGGPPTQAKLNTNLFGAVAVSPDGSLYIADWRNYRIRQIKPTLPGVDIEDLTVASEDGVELYIFTGSGRHLRTLNALTGTIRQQFGYDGAGRLISIVDGNGNTTTIQRDGSGNPTAIVAQGGQQTTLTVDANGYLATVTDPGGRRVQLGSSADGLLLTQIDPNGGNYRYAYDEMGFLIRDEDPAGGVKTLSRVEDPSGYTVTLVTALGTSLAYTIERLPTGAVRRTNSDANGALTVVMSDPDGTQTVTQPDGMLITSTRGPDPRFGMQAPYVVKRVRTLPGGLVETLTAQRTVTLADPGNVLSLQTLADSVTVNGRTFTRSYNAVTRTLTDTSAEGRQIVSVLDTQGRIVQQTPAPGIAPITVTYDAQGRVSENRQGGQFWTFGYDGRNRITTRTDGGGRVVSFLYDDSDRVVGKILPSGAAYQFAYDANGNRTQVILPSGAVHGLAYTPVNLDAAYTPPVNGSYQRTHNADGELTSSTLPGGRVVTQAYDVQGRLSGIADPGAATVFGYGGDLTERVTGINHVPAAGAAQNIAYSYKGGLISGMIATGAAPAQVSYTFNNNLFPIAMSMVSAADTVASALTWDQDGMLTGFGPFALIAGGPGGALSQITDGTANTSTSYGYDALARIVTRTHQVNGQQTYALQLTYDLTGRVIAKSETIGGVTQQHSYAYDADGQLLEVRRDGTPTELYAYDINGNRTGSQYGAGPPQAASVDVQDRLTLRGGVTYQFDADGFLAQRGTDSFQYNARGWLRQASVAGQAITYDYDGLGRRVSRTDAAGITQYLYGDPASHIVTAVRSPTGQLTTLYYDTAGLLIALERGGARYHVATDQVGSPRVVSNSAGAIQKVVEFDSFGIRTSDSNPGFELPIGYAGGLADAATGLVHFGLRDFEPESGRWTARDPVLFESGQGNLYAYVSNNPIGNRDPLGLFCVSVTAYDGIGGGAQTCFTTEGASVCLEVGFGVGGGVGADMGGLEKDGGKVGLEVGAKCGPAGAGGEISLDTAGCLKAGPNIQLGPVKLKKGKVEGKDSLDAAKVKLSAECSGSGKLFGRICHQEKL